jgi:hypothetical protein
MQPAGTSPAQPRPLHFRIEFVPGKYACHSILMDCWYAIQIWDIGAFLYVRVSHSNTTMKHRIDNLIIANVILHILGQERAASSVMKCNYEAESK